MYSSIRVFQCLYFLQRLLLSWRRKMLLTSMCEKEERWDPQHLAVQKTPTVMVILCLWRVHLSLKADHPSISVTLGSHSLISVSWSLFDHSLLVSKSHSQVDCTAAVVIQVDCEGKDWCCLTCIRDVAEHRPVKAGEKQTLFSGNYAYGCFVCACLCVWLTLPLSLIWVKCRTWAYRRTLYMCFMPGEWVFSRQTH